MTDTPRTDAVLASYFNPGPSRLCDLARELERELNAANATIRQQQLLEEENLRLKDRIKRLEKAGDALYEKHVMADREWLRYLKNLAEELIAANRKLVVAGNAMEPWCNDRQASQGWRDLMEATP